MNKIILFVIILALIWALPPVRARIAEVAHPVLERMGPVGEAMIRPAQREAAKKQVTSIVRALAADLQEGSPPPTGTAFQVWMRRRMPELSGRDPWDNPYWAEYRRDVLFVGSNGPDGVRGTADDITQSVLN
ncbi:MAG TPA: hypothetical protein VK936_10590 [Longimicrobiales bacterium]|nr:hypothetical protein [Longimicrobiales bacterium]